MTSPDGILRRIDLALQKAPRANFLPPESAHLAGEDVPINIGYGQTNSQPSTVRRMLEWLDVMPGNTVLNVGSGSGWTTALLSFLAGNTGFVIAVERIPELVEFGERNCERLGITNVQFYLAGPFFGWPGEPPYDRIHVCASADEMPSELNSQLADHGRAVVPIQESIWVFDKKRGILIGEEHRGYSFVALV